ncbi:MAG: YfhO family protein [Anaerolineales bacterium]
MTLQLLTHIQIFFYTACLAAAYAAWGLSERQKNNPPVYSRVAGIVPLFVALSAAQLFPLLGLLPYASRQAFSLEDATWYSLPPALLFTVFSPTSFQFPEWVLYPGAVSLVLAFVAFFGRARRAAYFWGGVVLFALLYAVGTATPLFPLLHLIPGFAQLRIPPRIWFIGGYALTVLAGLGAEAATEEIASRRLRRWRRHVRRLALIVYGGEAAAIMGLPLILKAFPWQLAVTLIASLITIGLLAAHARRMRCIRGRIRSRHLLIGLLVLLLAELAPTAYLYTEPVPISEILLEPPALSFLRQQPGLWRVYSSHGELPYAMAATEGIEAAEGLLALQMGHYVELIKQASGCTIKGYGTGVPPCLTAEVDPAAYQQARPQAGLLGLLNVRYVLTSIPYDDPDLRLVARFGDEGDRPRSWVYENQRWLPRAFVVFHAQTLPNQAAVLDALSKVDLARTAVLAESLPDPFAEPSPPGSLPPVTAEVVARSANSLTIRTHLTHLTGRAQITRPGLLVVSQTWMPGWQAWVDGQPAHVIRVDYALQGVVLPPGEHEVVLRYQPAGWQLGWRLSVSTLAVVGVLFVYSVVRYRAPAAPP